jgi:hypothetical protein
VVDGIGPGVELVIGQHIGAAVPVVAGIADAPTRSQRWKPTRGVVSAAVLCQKLLAITRRSQPAANLGGIDCHWS